MSQCVRLWKSADPTRRTRSASGAGTGAVTGLAAAVPPVMAQVMIKVYPGSPQALLADHRPSYREADAKDGWQRLQNCLKTNRAA